MGALRVGILGLRHLHPRSYMPLFQAVPDLKVVAAAEHDPAVLEPFVRDFQLRGYRDWRELVARERIDLAVVFLPHADCPDAAVACAEGGINLLIEKPMAASVSGLRRVLTAVQAAGVILSVPYVWRYHPVSREMRRLISQGTLGSIVGCEGRCAAGRLQRYVEGHAEWMLQKELSGGGPMLNLGVHWIDLFRWLLNDEIVEVLAKNVRISPKHDIEDNSFALLTFSRGPVLMLDISYTVPDSYPNGRDLYLALRGTHGVLSWSPSFEGTHETLFVCGDTGEFAAPGGRYIDFDLPPHSGYTGTLGVEFLTDLAGSIRAKSAPAITGADGLRALEVVEAIYQSAATGRAISVLSI